MEHSAIYEALELFREGFTVNREYFDVKILSDSMVCAKIKHTKCTCNISDNAGTGSFVRKLFNAKNYCMKYFRHKIFAIYSRC